MKLAVSSKILHIGNTTRLWYFFLRLAYFTQLSFMPLNPTAPRPGSAWEDSQPMLNPGDRPLWVSTGCRVPVERRQAWYWWRDEGPHTWQVWWHQPPQQCCRNSEKGEMEVSGKTVARASMETGWWIKSHVEKGGHTARADVTPNSVESSVPGRQDSSLIHILCGMKDTE